MTTSTSLHSYFYRCSVCPIVHSFDAKINSGVPSALVWWQESVKLCPSLFFLKWNQQFKNNTISTFWNMNIYSHGIDFRKFEMSAVLCLLSVSKCRFFISFCWMNIFCEDKCSKEGKIALTKHISKHLQLRLLEIFDSPICAWDYF